MLLCSIGSGTYETCDRNMEQERAVNCPVLSIYIPRAVLYGLTAAHHCSSIRCIGEHRCPEICALDDSELENSPGAL